MAFENFPYSNFHELNLDWILERVKEAYSASNPPDYPVTSVNGQTGDVIIAIPSALVRTVNGESGDVILYRNPLIQFPTTDESRWNLFRICDGNSGDARGIEFDEDGAHRIEGVRRILIYDEENQPDYPVTSVNGMTGDVRITAGVNSVNGKTGNVVTPFVNPNTDILQLDSNSNTVLWGISRNVAGGNVALYISRGTGTPQAFIRYTPDQGEAVNLPLLSSADIPESAGVISVNTKTGAVTLYGTDILLNNTSADSITQYLLNVESNVNFLMDSLIKSDDGTEALTWQNGFYYADTGAQGTSSILICSNNIPEKYYLIRPSVDNIQMILYAWDSNNNYVGVLNKANNTFAPDSTLAAHYYDSFDMQELREMYPGYVFRITAKYYPTATIVPGDASNIDLYYIAQTGGDSEAIEELRTEVNEHTTQISALQTADSNHDQQITALQAKDNTHDQQITALQTTDTSLAQQISALQTADSNHDQQITALQAKDNTQDQQIAELYTRTGVYVVSISNANTLPLRYPATGTDEKIKDTNKVVSMDLSIPGAQVSDWTITTYDGYLEISGTINGGTDMTLYLA